MSGGAPPLYLCELCGFGIDINSNQCLRLMLGWARGKGKTLVSVEQEQYRYRHDFCFGQKERDEQETLF